MQSPHPPIWIGGTGPKRTLPLVARYADAWHGFGTPNSLRETSARIDELATEAGRDPAAILRAGSLSLDDLDTARKHAAKWRDAGYGYLVCGWPGAGRCAGRGLRPRGHARPHVTLDASMTCGKVAIVDPSWPDPLLGRSCRHHAATTAPRTRTVARAGRGLLGRLGDLGHLGQAVERARPCWRAGRAWRSFMP